MNPYDFVRVDWQHAPRRRLAAPHNAFRGLSGRIEATLTAETPLFIKRGNLDSFFSIGGQPAIGGSSLKGLFRSVVETVAQGCFLFCAEPGRLPNDFKPCHRPDGLCTACRLFGLIKGSTLRLGNVSFGDAICTKREAHPPIYTAILSSPKPRHSAFYLSGPYVAGRKYYFHHRPDNMLTAKGWLPSNKRPQNQYIQPLGAGSTFAFSADFDNVVEDDFAALLYAMTLDEGMRHKFGYAKPCGLGSVHIRLSKLTVRDQPSRYRQATPALTYEGADLLAEINRRVAPFVSAIPAVTLLDLRRIWGWPAADNVTYRYPTQEEFATHRSDPVGSTDGW
jgi:CRISPR/Cas system CSM-associated protein Csm3 (group 7 of RAMP superfamily)